MGLIGLDDWDLVTDEGSVSKHYNSSSALLQTVSSQFSKTMSKLMNYTSKLLAFIQ